VISFWERESLLHADVVIVGAGITGLSVAASLKEKQPNHLILVLERSVLPYGASTRNAGFACFGSLTEIVSDIDHMGEEAARELLFQRWMGLQITRKRLSDKAIGYEDAGGFELVTESSRSAIERVASVNQLVDDFLPEYITNTSARKTDMGILADGSLYSMAQEGQVHSGDLMAALESYVTSLGVIVRTGAEVLHVASDRVEVRDSHRGTFDVRTGKVVVCTNAFARALIDVDVEPGRGQVFITKPIEGLKFKGNLHVDEGFYYLRNVGDRLLFGGARNHFFEQERTHDFEVTDEVQQHLASELKRIFGPDLAWEVDQRWSGIMAFGKEKLPIVQHTDDGLLVALKMSGMGIALAGFIGEEVADMIN